MTKAPTYKRCATCQGILRLVSINGRVCYMHVEHVSRKICAIRKAAQADKKSKEAK